MTPAFLIAALIAMQAAPAAERTDTLPPETTPVELSLESKAGLRCAAAFALVSYGQSTGDPFTANWPNLGDRGREFFVRELARIMDETGLDRAGIDRLASREAQELIDKGEVDAVMPSCLVLLEQSVR